MVELRRASSGACDSVRAAVAWTLSLSTVVDCSTTIPTTAVLLFVPECYPSAACTGNSTAANKETRKVHSAP
jgi:hypothetical protein